MRNLTATICLTIAVLLGSAGVSWSGDYRKGLTAYKSGDYATALREWTPIAEEGYGFVQYHLGVMYENGEGVPQNDKTAFKWYTIAAEPSSVDRWGSADAQFTLGQMYEYGKGVPQDNETAMEYYTLAALDYRFGGAHAGAEIALKGLQRKIAEALRVEELSMKVEREKLSASNPGFRDIRPGLYNPTIMDLKVCEGNLSSWTVCYGLQDLKFRGTFDSFSFLEKLTVDLGPIVQMEGETNIYANMRNTLGEKYKMDFEFSERDRQLFNEDSKDKLYSVYHGGQVALLINWKKRDYSKDLWLYIEYRDVKPAQIFLESTKPKRATSSDF